MKIRTLIKHLERFQFDKDVFILDANGEAHSIKITNLPDRVDLEPLEKMKNFHIEFVIEGDEPNSPPNITTLKAFGYADAKQRFEDNMRELQPEAVIIEYKVFEGLPHQTKAEEPKEKDPNQLTEKVICPSCRNKDLNFMQSFNNSEECFLCKKCFTTFVIYQIDIEHFEELKDNGYFEENETYEDYTTEVVQNG